MSGGWKLEHEKKLQDNVSPSLIDLPKTGTVYLEKQSREENITPDGYKPTGRDRISTLANSEGVYEMNDLMK